VHTSSQPEEGFITVNWRTVDLKQENRMATNALTARKPIDHIIKDGERHGLSKTSGKVSITALGIGAIMAPASSC